MDFDTIAILAHLQARWRVFVGWTGFPSSFASNRAKSAK
jgi:hypothetical protein